MKTMILCAIVASLALSGALAQEGNKEESRAPLVGEDALVKLLPSPAEIPGWKPDGEPLYYAGDSLWEYNDGAAENFLSFDFREMLAQNYVSAAGKGLLVEIYEQGSSLMAYGIFAQMRSPGVTPENVGKEGFSDEYSLDFWKANLFVRVAIFENDPALHRELDVFGRAIADRIPAEGELPPEISAFPAEGLVPQGLCYLTTAVMGREKYPPSFVGLYKIGDEQAKLYLSTLPNREAALDTFAWYTEGLTTFQAKSFGATEDTVMGLGSDPFQGDVLAFSVGSYMGVLTGLKKPAEAGTGLVRKMIDRLKEIDADRELKKRGE